MFSLEKESKMAKFYSRSNYPATIPCPECSENVPTFTLKINKETGKKELKKTGETNLYQKIQAAKEETLIYNIIKRFENGDIEALNKTHGTYGDFSNMPKTLAEAQQSLIDAENTFNSLPLDVRRQFNMSSSEFVASLTNGKFEAVMAKIQGDKPKVQETQQTTQQVTQAQPAQQNQQMGGIKYE